jgi:hypothetical protein
MVKRFIEYKFSAEVWQHTPPGGWYFVSLPDELTIQIRGVHQTEEEGWGRLKAVSKIGNSEWKTAIWFDTKKNTYLLPLKAEIRQKELIKNGETVKVSIWI